MATQKDGVPDDTPSMIAKVAKVAGVSNPCVSLTNEITTAAIPQSTTNTSLAVTSPDVLPFDSEI